MTRRLGSIVLKVVIAASILAVAAGCAPQGGGRWETTESGCQVWNDEPLRQAKITWSGKCLDDGKASGRGIYVISFIKDGKKIETRYEGRMRDGDKTGPGTLSLANGDRYTGGFSDGIKQGKGTYTWANGDSYTGEFRDDKMHGEGLFRWASGGQYQGEFRDGVITCRGKFIGLTADDAQLDCLKKRQ